MKLARNTEWAVIGALILYIAFTPGIRVVKDILATPLGKALGLGLIVYVWKFVSPIIAILLTISFMRCAKWNVWEMFSGAEAACTCENSAAIWDPQSKTCKDTSGNVAGPVKTCTCANGYTWDGGEKGTKQCVPVTSDQPPVPPPENPTGEALAKAIPSEIAPLPPPPTPNPPPPAPAATTPTTAPTTTETFMGIGTSLGASAPVTEGRKAPSEVPQTTGSAGALLLRDSFVPPQGYGGVQPGAGILSGPASV